MKKIYYLLLAFLFIFSVGSNAQSLKYYSKAAATDFNDVASWGLATDGTGVSPTSILSTDTFVVANASLMSLTANAAIARLFINSGTLTVAANSLDISHAVGNNSGLSIASNARLTVTGGSINLNGQFAMVSGAKFAQSGGTITVDGNAGGVALNSVTGNIVALYSVVATDLQLTGGSIVIVGPSYTTSYAFWANCTVATNATAGHTIQYGDGVSTDAGGTNGFYSYLFPGSSYLIAGNIIANGGAGTNRFVSTLSNHGVLGNLTINSGSEYRAGTHYINGNVVNNGTLTTTGTLGFANYTSAILNPTTVAQTITGAGVFRNSATTITASVTSFYVNNTNTAGVTAIPTTNIATQPANSFSVSGTLTLVAGRLFMPSGFFVLGISTPTAGTLTVTSGGFASGTTFGRWWTAAGTGSAITVGTDPTTTTSRYPFVTSALVNRSAWLTRATPSGAAGVLAMTYNEAAGTSVVAIADGAYTATQRSNDNWTVSILSGTPTAAASLAIDIVAPGVYGTTPPDATTRVTLSSSVIGTYNTGTTTPGGYRTAITPANIINTFYLAMNIPTCSGTPVGGIAASSITSNCGGGTTNLSLTGQSTGLGLSFQWQSSPAGAGTWTDISGATNITYPALAFTASNDYRCNVTCVASGLTTASSTATVTVYNCSYDVARSTGATFTAINGSGASFTGFSGSDDAYSSATNIGFNFVYKGNTFTQLVVNTNGFLVLGATAPGASFTNNFNSGTFYQNLIAPLWDDWVTQGNAGGASVGNFIKYRLSGTSPNQVLTIEWFGMERFSYAGPNINFQVKLYEGSNNIEFIYGNMLMFDGTTTSASASANSYSIGLSGPATSTGLDRIMALQASNTNCFNVIDPVANGNSIECNTMYTFTSGGSYTACTAPAITAPANDEIAGALTLPVNASPCTDLCGTYYTTTGSTASMFPTSSCPTAPDDDVWFKFVATSTSQTITVRSATGNDAVIGLYDNSQTEIAGSGCVNATGVYGLTEVINATSLILGDTYYLRLSNLGVGLGNNNGFSICINQVILPPNNDDPCGAQSLTVGAAGVCTPYEDNPASLPSKTAFIAATNTTTNGVVAPTCTGAGTTVQDVWFSFTATATSQNVTVAPKSGTNAAFQLYSSTGTCGSSDLALTSISCINVLSTGGTESNLYTGLTLGNLYYVRVYSHPSGQGGAPVSNSQFSICVNEPTPAPNCTTNISPADLATNVVTIPNAPLSWNSVATATSYDVYIGTVNPPTALLGNYTTTTTSVIGFAASTVYYWYVVPKNATGNATGCTANITSFTTSAVCNPSTSNGGTVGDALTDFVLTGETATAISVLGATPIATPGYIDLTATTTVDLVIGKAYAGNFQTQDANDYVTIWIDWNNNGGFESNEMILNNLKPIAAATTTNYSILIPATATLGTHKMRVRDVYYSSAPTLPSVPCGNYTYGEGKDFTVNIVASGAPYVVSSVGAAACVNIAKTTIDAASNNSSIQVPILDATGAIVAQLNANGNDLGTITSSVYRNTAAVRQAGGSFYMDRNITITPAIQPAVGNVDVRIYYTAAELAALTVVAPITSSSTVTVTKTAQVCSPAFTGTGVFLAHVADGTIGLDYYIDVATPAFSTFYINSATGVLPVSIEYFKGTKQSSANHLDWKVTCASIPSLTISLERSADGRSFKAIHEENALAVRCLQAFDYTDVAPLMGANYYRLKLTTPTGEVSYSKIVVLLNKEKGFELISIAPNPVKNVALLTLTSVKAGKIDIAISDVTGKIVAKQTITVIAGNNPVNMNFATLGAGTYVITAKNADGEMKTTRFVKY
jgi:GEVED domain/Secretion system C-terminal sorting domain